MLFSDGHRASWPKSKENRHLLLDVAPSCRHVITSDLSSYFLVGHLLIVMHFIAMKLDVLQVLSELFFLLFTFSLHFLLFLITTKWFKTSSSGFLCSFQGQGDNF